MIKESAHEFARGVQARNYVAVGIDDLGAGIDTQAAERKGDAAGHTVDLERWLIDRVRPVRFRHRQSLGAAPVLDIGIEENIGAHGRIVLLKMAETSTSAISAKLAPFIAR